MAYHGRNAIDPVEETDRTFGLMATNKDLSPLERMNQLQAEMDKLKEQAVQELDSEISNLESQIADLKLQRTQITGEQEQQQKGRKKSGLKTEKKQVSAKRLEEMFSEKNVKEISMRAENLDTDQVKGVILANPDKFALGGKTPWWTVKLKGSK